MEKSAVYYADYLQLDKILTAQQPRSGSALTPPAQDEMLFIIIHQAYELWFKQILHELNNICATLTEPVLADHRISGIEQRLGRIVEIQKLLLQQLSILRTMTSMDFLEFRDFLVPASGFQSVQFRILEMRIGLELQQSVAQTAHFNQLQVEHQQELLDLEQQPSLFSLVEQWLLRMPFLTTADFDFWQAYQQAVQSWLTTQSPGPVIPNACPSNDVRYAQWQNETTHFTTLFDEQHYLNLQQQGLCRLAYRAMQAALFIYLYRDQPVFHLPYQLLARLVEIDELLAQWRYSHLAMVQRMIGCKMGTGGTSGYHYLQKTLEKPGVFADLANLATCIIPRSALPQFPDSFAMQLGFQRSKAG